jgi:multicomponent K+:H+ antiporter subunit G
MIADILIALCLVIGGVFGLVGSYGLIKLQDTMQRLHAPTKATTLGVGGVLIASMLYFLLVEGTLSFHELMISIFLFLTAPITAHFMAQTYTRLAVRQKDLPETETPYGWSIYDDPPVTKADNREPPPAE